MFFRLHNHRLKRITSTTHLVSNLKSLLSLSSSKSSIFKFKPVPTRSTEICQFCRNLSTFSSSSSLASTSTSLSSRFYPEFIPRRNYSSSASSFSIFPTFFPISIFNNDSRSSRVDLKITNDDPTTQSNPNSSHESTSVHQIFDIFTSLQENGGLTEKYSCQCLVSLWNHHASIFSPVDPTTPYIDRLHHIKILKEHPVFQSIIHHITTNCKFLGDESLSKCLHILTKFDFPIRHPSCQKLIEELLRRKSQLGSSALSLLCQSLSNESLYEDLVLAELAPEIQNHASYMKSDFDILNISIALQSSHRAQSSSVIKKYQERLSNIWHTESDLRNKLEPVTLCKIIMLLHDTLPVTMEMTTKCDDSNGNSKRILSGASLIRNYGNLLAPHVSDMSMQDIAKLYKFIQQRQDPVKLIEGISSRVFQLLELGPNLEIITCVQPTNLEQRNKLASFISDFMETCTYFDKVWHLILRVLFKTNYDRELYDKFWGKITELILEQKNVNVQNEDSDRDSDRFYANACEKDLFNSRYKILLFTHDYLRFMRLTSNTYSHPTLERLLYQEVLQLVKDAQDTRVHLTPSEYAESLSFLIYRNHPNIEHQWSSNFFKNFKILDLLNIHKGLKLRKKMKDSYFISNAINKQAENILRDCRGSLNPFDYLGVGMLSVEFQKTFDSCPNFLECMDKLVSVSWGDSRVMRELMLLVLRTGYYSPELFDRASEFILELGEEIPLYCAEKFALASYVCCADGLEGLPICAEIVKRNFESAAPLALLQSMLSFCYHGCLDLELINHIFQVNYLDTLSEQTKAFPGGSNQPKRIRKIFMELNRAVCIDKPEANVPWFHQQYCEEVASVYNPRETYLHHEVGQVLSEVFDGHDVIAKNVFSPYNYIIDFLLQFDKNGSPIKPNRNGVHRQDASTKVAILLNSHKDFTQNVRRLKGYHRMKTRHLEILGYQVIHVDPMIWNSMRMSERLAKNEYLESCIFKRSQSQLSAS